MNEQSASRQRQHERRKGLLANFLLMAGSGYFELLTGLFRSILVMRLLGPTGNGLIGMVRLAQQYLANSHLGALHGISKHLPRALGEGDEQRAQAIEDVGGTWVLLTAAVAAAGLLTLTLLWPELAPATRQVLVLGAAIYVCGRAYDLYRIIGRSWQVFGPLAVASVVFSLSLTAFMTLGAWLGWAEGATWGWLAAMLLALAPLHFLSGFRLRPRLQWSMVAGLMLAGIPLAAMAFGDTLLLTLDGTLLLRRGATSFGLYAGVAMQTRRYLFNLSRALTFVLLPHLLEEYARHKRVEQLRRTALNATWAAACAAPLLSLVSALLLPPAARALVPKFYAAVPAGQIVAFATSLMILPLVFGSVLVALDREWLSIASQAAGAAVIALVAWGPAGKGELEAVALASAVGILVTGLAVSVAALNALGLGPARLLATVASLHIPLAWSILAFVGAGIVAQRLGAADAETWAGCAVRLAIACPIAAPIAYAAERRYRFAGRLARLLSRATWRNQAPGNGHGNGSG